MRTEYSDYFKNTPLSAWHPSTFREWCLNPPPGSTRPAVWSAKLYESELQRLIDKKPEYASLTSQGRNKAMAIKKLLKNKKVKHLKSRARRTVNQNVTTNHVGDVNAHGNVIIGDVDDTHCNNLFSSSQNAFDGGLAAESNAEDDEDDMTYSTGPLYVRSLWVSKEPDFSLPSGRKLREFLITLSESDSSNAMLLQQNIIFVQRIHSHFEQKDISALLSMVPSLSPLPEEYSAYVELAASAEEGVNVTVPEGTSGKAKADKWKLWMYIYIAHMRVKSHMTWISSVQNHAGEVWTDVNIWSSIIDDGIRGHPEIFVNRREIESVFGDGEKFDAIIRSFVPSIHIGSDRRYTHCDVGFIETKPERLPHYADARLDQRKVIEIMRKALIKIKYALENDESFRNDEACMKNVVIVGIVTNGRSITLYRASNPHSDFLFFAEERHILTADSLANIMAACYRLMMTCVDTYKTIVNALARTILPP